MFKTIDKLLKTTKGVFSFWLFCFSVATVIPTLSSNRRVVMICRLRLFVMRNTRIIIDIIIFDIDSDSIFLRFIFQICFIIIIYKYAYYYYFLVLYKVTRIHYFISRTKILETFLFLKYVSLQ